MKKLLLGIAFALGFAPTAFAQYAGPGPGPIPGPVIGTTTGTAYDGGLGAAAAATASAALPKAGGTMTGTITNGTLSGTVASTAVRVATGTTASRSIADADADSINVMDDGADPTGATDSHTAFNSAVTTACSFSPPKTITLPRNGVFQLATPVAIPSGCNGFTMTSAQAELTGGSSDSSNPVLLSFTNTDNVTLSGITFDGSNLTSASTHGLVIFTAPMRGVTLTDDTFQNGAFNNGIWFYSADSTYQINNLTGTTSVAVVGGTDSQVTVSNFTTLGGLHNGAYIDISSFENDLYVTGFNSGTGVITTNKIIPDSVPASSRITFTPAASLTAIAAPGSKFLALDTTVGIATRQTAIQTEGTCIPVNDRVVSISSSPVGVTLEAAPVCSMASGTYVAFSSGIADVTMTDNQFTNLGQGLRYGLANSYTSFADMPGGTSTQEFTCYSANCTAGIGLAIGDQVATAQGGLPAGDTIVARAINSPSTGYYTVTYATPSSATDTPVASYTFNTSALAGNGYGFWLSYGAWFSNRNWVLNGNTYTHTWSSAAYLSNVSDYMAVNDKCDLDFMMTQNVTVAGSACKAIGNSRNIVESNLIESGSTGVGISLQHDIDGQIIGGSYSYNAVDGVDIVGGRSMHVSGGGVSKDNDQAANAGLAQIIAPNTGSGNGITLAGGYNYSLSGALGGATIGDWYSYDDQTTPTQQYGVGKGNNPAATTQTVGVTFTGKLAGTGNVQGLSSSLLLSAPTSNAGVVQAGSTNESGSVNESTSITSDTITFSTLVKNPPFQNGHCTVSSPTGASFTALTDPVTTSLTITHASTSGAHYTWRCSDNAQ